MQPRYAAMLIVTLLWAIPSLASRQNESAVSSQVLATYAGTYQITPGLKMTVALDGGRLVARFPDSPALPLDVLSEKKFRIAAANVELEFFKNETGEVTHVVLNQNGQHQSATRRKDRKPVTVSTEILKRYVGTYARRSGIDLVITLEGDRLMGESTGQFKHAMFAESETSFFFEDVDAQIEFANGENGVVDRLVLHRGSVHESAPRK